MKMNWRNVGLAQRFDLYCRHLSATKRPIILGPWRSEVGFEALYWLPFLTKLRERYGWDAKRLIALSRGGAGVWYQAGQVAELYDYLDPETVRLHTWQRMQRSGSLKQVVQEPWEQPVIGLVKAKLGIDTAHVLHPSWMYRLLRPYWEDTATFRQLSHWIDFHAMAQPPLPPQIQLPKKFVAIRFYARPTWQSHELLHMWMRQLVERISEQQPVVLLNSNGRYDDHADQIAPKGDRIVDLSAILTPQNNLAIQSAVLARASLFVGTYGGLSQLAVRLGVPTVACYTEWQGTALAHLDLTNRVSVASSTPFWLTRPKDADRLIGCFL